MVKGLLPSWFSDIRGWLNVPAYIAAIFLGGVFPFLLYFASCAESFRLASREGLDTKFVAINWLAPLILVLLALAFVISWLQTPHRATMVRKLGVATRGRGLVVPLVLSGFAFYAPMPWLAFSKAMGSAEGEGLVVATPLIQSSFSVYLVVLSVTVLIRYFFVTAVVQTHISGFTRNLTADLNRLARSGKGNLTISLPWLAFGKRSLDPELFDEFRSALEKCLSDEKICVRVYTLHANALRQGAKKAIDDPDNKLNRQTFHQFLECESEIRQLAGQIAITRKADLLHCVIINEKLYAVHTVLHEAQEEGHLGAFISMEIDDESICAEYRRRLEFIAS